MWRSKKKSFRAISEVLKEAMACGTLEQRQIDALKKALKRLDHAISIRDLHKVESAVANLAKLFTQYFL